MALVNEAKKEINAKIVYMGQSGSGKKCALTNLYSRVNPEFRSDLKSMSVGDHQMLFFDFSCPPSAQTDGYRIRFHLYTITGGGDSSPAPWKMLLKGADAVVLFADSAKGRMYGNLEACAQLLDALTHYGKGDGATPVLLQCNKKDLEAALSASHVAAEILPELAASAMSVSAMSGEGLMEGLAAVKARIFANLGFSHVVEAKVDTPVEPLSVRLDEEYSVCSGAAGGISVVQGGAAVRLDGGGIVIPLTLKSDACGKSIDFSITVSIGREQA